MLSSEIEDRDEVEVANWFFVSSQRISNWPELHGVLFMTIIRTHLLTHLRS
jgi:hypothetical protein